MIKLPQPYKGVRVQHTLRLPVDLHRVLLAQAKLRHWTMNDLIVRTLEAEFETPDPVGVRPNVNEYDDDGKPLPR